MASRPRRAAAQKANHVITDMVDSDNHTSSRTGRIMSSRTSSRRSEVKLPASKLRHATSSRSGPSSRQVARENFVGGEIIEGKRNRSQKKSYVLDTSDDDEDDDEDAEGEDDDMVDMGEDDAEGEIIVDDTMDLDAEGDDDDDEDAEGEDDDMDMDSAPPPAPVIKVSKPPTKSSITSKPKPPTKSAIKAIVPQVKDSDDDDEELSELESDADEIQDTIKIGGGDEDDAEGEDEEIEEPQAAAEADDLGSDDDLSQAETPDLSKMTKRQRARFEDGGELMKLSDEVQAKKHFTAEELSMRRAEMARRRRNLSDKRNEEVKMETINKLLKKQAPKTNKKSQLADDEAADDEAMKPSPIFVRWISNKEGSLVAIPDAMLTGPAGRVFVSSGLKSGKMVEEVS
ncbi:PAPA-1-like conserved region-domain-containing protein [Xylariomycetidae sp. FL2044]|nr:PAPA-1-like conserved region-domain-containing protein [Xylariomycetidae sp. FL2044]